VLHRNGRLLQASFHHLFNLLLFLLELCLITLPSLDPFYGSDIFEDFFYLLVEDLHRITWMQNIVLSLISHLLNELFASAASSSRTLWEILFEVFGNSIAQEFIDGEGLLRGCVLILVLGNLRRLQLLVEAVLHILEKLSHPELL
jgi:hypothetical protein